MITKAKMRDNLVERYKEVLPGECDNETELFLKSIEGKEVTLKFTGEDAFEIEDDNVWLPDCLWDEILEGGDSNAR